MSGKPSGPEGRAARGWGLPRRRVYERPAAAPVRSAASRSSRVSRQPGLPRWAGKVRPHGPEARTTAATLTPSATPTIRLRKTREFGWLIQTMGFRGLGAAGAANAAKPTTGLWALALSVKMIVRAGCVTSMRTLRRDMPSVAGGPVGPVGPVLPTASHHTQAGKRIEVRRRESGRQRSENQKAENQDGHGQEHAHGHETTESLFATHCRCASLLLVPVRAPTRFCRVFVF